MRPSTSILLLSFLALASAHGDHVEEDVNPDATYAELHMAQEHHFDSFDISAFFHLHDLNRDGILDVNELESIYGVHHEKVKKKSGSEEVHTAQAQKIVQTVLKNLDTNGDGVLTMREFVAGGVGGLPNFKGVDHLGHHYDAEGEYFLHHEEKYHNTPETQNEEDYVHPEDIEHFMAHEDIEAEEEKRVLEFQGLAAEELTDDPDEIEHQRQQALYGVPSKSLHDVDSPEEDEEDNTPFPIKSSGLTPAEQARLERASFAKAQAEKFAKDAREARRRGEWGEGGKGFGRPKDAADRMRKAIPYKFKIKKSFWGEF